MAKRKRRKKKPQPSWWLPFLHHSDQEIERGRFLYSAVAEDEGDKFCFEKLLQAVEFCMENARKLDPKEDQDRWLFYAALFHGAGCLLKERIDYYQPTEEDPNA